MFNLWDWVFINLFFVLLQHWAAVEYMLMEQDVRMVDVRNYFDDVDSGKIPRVIDIV